MQKLGPSLEDLFNSSGKQFSLKTVLLLADQLIQRIEFIHQRGYIHRDVKPDNFLMGIGPRRHYVHLVDFGLAKRFKNQHTDQHIPFKTDKNLTGTARYASMWTHMGFEQSRRDDLECLGFMLIYLFRGSLPWQGVKEQDKKVKYEKIRKLKEQWGIQKLCEDAGLPEEFVQYFDLVRSFEFEEKPDYSALRCIFKDLLYRSGYDFDFYFDWTTD